jgi:oligosaccharide repeat unit polymerase
MTTLLAGLAIVLALVLSRRLWRHRLNPITAAVLVWAPAFVLATLPREFLLPVYNHLNKDLGVPAFTALTVSFLTFSAGVVAGLSVIGSRGWDLRLQRNQLRFSDMRLGLLYSFGLVVLVYSLATAGLGDALAQEARDVADSRAKLHLGPISFAVLFLDIGAIAFLARMLETGRKVYGIPMAVAVLAHIATLHKSPTVFLVIACIFLFLMYPAQARQLMLGTRRRRVATLLMVLSLLGSLVAMNALRGIGVFRLTSFESDVAEQAYIYSGATAILNLSAAIEGHVPTEPPKLGMLLARPLTWHLANRDQLNATKYFEGINTATYLIYPWVDFRWPGFFVTPFLTGLAITTLLWCSLRKSITGLVMGAVAMQAVLFSVNTDVVFDPTTWILIALAAVAQLAAGQRRPVAAAGPAAPSPDPWLGVAGRHAP